MRLREMVYLMLWEYAEGEEPDIQDVRDVKGNRDARGDGSGLF